VAFTGFGGSARPREERNRMTPIGTLLLTWMRGEPVGIDCLRQPLLPAPATEVYAVLPRERAGRIMDNLP
jgi:hypothetical protein